MVQGIEEQLDRRSWIVIIGDSRDSWS